MSFTLHTASFKSMDEMVAACALKTERTRHTIAVGGTATVKDFTFTIDQCAIKYKPTKYDKLVVVIPTDAARELNKLRVSILTDAEPYVRDNSISIKLTPDQQARINREFSVNDACNVHVKFDAAWTIQGKMYATFKLESITRIGGQAMFVKDW